MYVYIPSRVLVLIITVFRVYFRISLKRGQMHSGKFQGECKYESRGQPHTTYRKTIWGEGAKAPLAPWNKPCACYCTLLLLWLYSLDCSTPYINYVLIQLNSNVQHEELEKKLLDQMVEHLHAKEKEFREEIEKKVRVIAIVLWFEITELIVEQHIVCCSVCSLYTAMSSIP